MEPNGPEEHGDTYWKARLPAEVYQALRAGVMEQPGTGAYVATSADGVYQCAACGTPVFSSGDKFDDGSGYAAFHAPIREGAVKVIVNYLSGGESRMSAQCVACKGRLGTVIDNGLRSANDLADGQVERTYEISSRAVRFKKALTPRNYPVATTVVVLALAIGGWFVWTCVSGLVGTTRMENRNGAPVELWVGDTPVYATVTHLDRIASDGLPQGGAQAVLLVLGGVDGTPRIHFSSHPVDILWLDSTFKVLGTLQGNDPTVPIVLAAPPGAVYALVIEQGVLATLPATGTMVTVADRSKLLAQ